MRFNVCVVLSLVFNKFSIVLARVIFYVSAFSRSTSSFLRMWNNVLRV